MPTSFNVTCAAKPSLFAYPKMTEAKKEEKKERVATVLLSTTARAKAREARKEKYVALRAQPLHCLYCLPVRLIIQYMLRAMIGVPGWQADLGEVGRRKNGGCNR